MAMNARHRYIVLNIGLWLLLAGAGAAGITLLRQYGSAVAERERARTVLARAQAHYDDGDFATCQAELTQALALAPSVGAEIVDRFGARLVALPNAAERLAAEAAGTQDTLTQARVEILRGNAERGGRLLESYAAAGGRDPRAALWRGRLAVNAARFAEARDYFMYYWRANESEKKTTLARLRAPSGADLEQRMQSGRDLFHAGLWTEAFAAFAELRHAGAADPELEFFQAVEEDLAGKSDDAKGHYRATLARLPGHLLALHRLRDME